MLLVVVRRVGSVSSSDGGFGGAALPAWAAHARVQRRVMTSHRRRARGYHVASTLLAPGVHVRTSLRVLSEGASFSRAGVAPSARSPSTKAYWPNDRYT